MSDQKKSDVKPEAKQLDPTVAEAMRLVAEQMIPAAIASAVAATQAGRPQAPAAPQRPSHEKCTECGQSKTGCGGRHVQAVVFPQRYPHHATYFQGVIINGVKYLSNDAGHKICIPSDAEASIQGIVAAFEQNEQDQALGRKATHHSGSLGQGSHGARSATAAWR